MCSLKCFPHKFTTGRVLFVSTVVYWSSSSKKHAFRTKRDFALRKRQLQIGGHFTIKVASCHKLIQTQAQGNNFKFGWDKDFNLAHKFQLDLSISPSRLDLLTKKGEKPRFNLERTITIHSYLKQCFFSLWKQVGHSLCQLMELAWKGLVKSTMFSYSDDRAYTVFKTNGFLSQHFLRDDWSPNYSFSWCGVFWWLVVLHVLILL